MISSSRAPAAYASVTKPARSPCGDRRSVRRAGHVRLAPLIDLAEHRAEPASSARAGLQGPRRLRHGVPRLAARDAEFHPLAGLIALALRQAQPQARRCKPQPLAIDADQLGAAEGTGEAEQKQRPVAQGGQVVLAAFSSTEVGRMALRRVGEVGAEDAAQGAGRGVHGGPVLAMEPVP